MYPTTKLLYLFIICYSPLTPPSHPVIFPYPFTMYNLSLTPVVVFIVCRSWEFLFFFYIYDVLTTFWGETILMYSIFLFFDHVTGVFISFFSSAFATASWLRQLFFFFWRTTNFLYLYSFLFLQIKLFMTTVSTIPLSDQGREPQNQITDLLPLDVYSKNDEYTSTLLQNNQRR